MNEAKRLIDIPADTQIVHGYLPQNAFSVNDVSGSERHSSVISVFDEAAVVLRDLLIQVRDHRDLHGSETAFVSRLLGPFRVCEVRVNRDSNDLAAYLSELVRLVTELAYFSRTHESEVEGPEEEHNILPLELLKADLLELVLVPCHGVERGSWLAEDCLLRFGVGRLHFSSVDCGL